MSLLNKLLITPKDISALKEFDLSTRPEKINPLILSAQRNDVMPLIKEKLYNAIVKNPENYQPLLNEGYYTFEDEEYVNFGLKAVIALFAHARYCMSGSATPTPYGLVEKANKDVSEQISMAYKKTLHGESQADAINAWGNVYLFLVRTKEPLFSDDCGCDYDETETGGMGFTIISRHNH